MIMRSWGQYNSWLSTKGEGCPKAEEEWPGKFVPLFEVSLHIFALLFWAMFHVAS